MEEFMRTCQKKPCLSAVKYFAAAIIVSSLPHAAIAQGVGVGAGVGGVGVGVGVGAGPGGVGAGVGAGVGGVGGVGAGVGASSGGIGAGVGASVGGIGGVGAGVGVGTDGIGAGIGADVGDVAGVDAEAEAGPKGLLGVLRLSLLQSRIKAKVDLQNKQRQTTGRKQTQTAARSLNNLENSRSMWSRTCRSGSSICHWWYKRMNYNNR